MASSHYILSPQDIRPLVSQVAGHSNESEKRSPGMLKHKDGYVLKPMLKTVKARTELEFYKLLASAQHSALAPFMPHYYGTASINTVSHKGEVIILEDVTESLLKPCIMDVKIGRQTWDPLASAAKIESEEGKYAECKRELGFCIPGFQVYDSESGKLMKFDKKYGKSLNKNTIDTAFSIFLNLHNKNSALKAIDVYICKLQKIIDVVAEQKSLHLYSSSILLSYDSEKLGTNIEASEWANVHMIDFAHAFTGQDHEQGVDENYLNGIRGLVQVLSTLKGSCKTD